MNSNELIYGWDEAAFKEIAKKSGSRQAVEDVSFCRIYAHGNPEQLIAVRWGMYCGALAIIYKKGIRIVMVATAEEYKRKGIATALIQDLTKTAQRLGKECIYTRTRDGVSFYASLKFKIIGKKDDGYIMEKRWKT